MEWQEEFECEEFLEIPQKTEKETLPAKSKKRYEFAYGRFKEWIKSHGINVISENVLLKYFYELSTTHKYSPPTLWNLYSMLNTTIKIFDNVDIEKYGKLLAFLKRKNVGYKAKQSKVFKATEIKRFLMEAPDNRYLLTKVAMIFGVAGGCRKGELPNVTINDIQELDGVLVVEMPETKTNIPRSFTIDEPFVTYVKMYLALRPPNVPTDRFFLNYQKGRCTVQVVGINKFGGMPKEVATFLGLKEPHLYTGHAFRRTSATLLANAGPSIISMQKPERWKSTQDEEGCIENLPHSENRTETTIQNESNCAEKNDRIDNPTPTQQKTSDQKTETATSMQDNTNDDLQSASEFTITRHNSQTCTINNKSGSLTINIQNSKVHIYNYKQ